MYRRTCSKPSSRRSSTRRRRRGSTSKNARSIGHNNMNCFSNPVRAAIMSALGALCAVTVAQAEDLMQIYREAQLNDPTLAAARATWQATQERIPQARSGLLPNVSATGAANYNNFQEHIHGDDVDPNRFDRNFRFGSLAVSASQPLYR